MIKNITRTPILGIFLITAALYTTTNANACVDFHNTIWVSCDYDTVQGSTTVTDIIITVHNMHLFGSPAGAFCTCGIENFTDMFSNILYVAFVDSGTTNPVAGFDPWSASAPAGTAWNNIQSGNWEGFLAETIGAGLNTGDPVELLIRASLPPGYTFSLVDSALYSTNLGTDEWDDAGDSLAMSHNSISWIASGGAPTYTQRPQSYFTAFDQQFSGLIDLSDIGQIVEVCPNPVFDKLTIRMLNKSQEDGAISVLNMSGQVLLYEPFEANARLLTLDAGGLSTGLYVLTVQTASANFTKKVVVR